MFRCKYTILREFTVVLAIVMNYLMTKYNVEVCCDKILVNVCVCVCVVNRILFRTVFPVDEG